MPARGTPPFKSFMMISMAGGVSANRSGPDPKYAWKDLPDKILILLVSLVFARKLKQH